MSEAFTFDGLAARVVFRRGALADVPAEAERLGIRRALVIAAPPDRTIALGVVAGLGTRAVRSFTREAATGPHEAAEEAIAVARANGADGTVAVGDGATLGIGKAVAARLGLKQIAVPTSYAGAEATAFVDPERETMAAVRGGRRKRPDTLVYDPVLAGARADGDALLGGFTALAHAVEGLYAPDGNPLTRLMAAESVRRLAAALPALAQDANDAAAREEATIAGWLAGSVMGAVSMGLHHDLVALLGGRHGLAYAKASAVLLPHTVAFNQAAARPAMDTLAAALGAEDPVAGLAALGRTVGAPASLEAVGFAPDAVDAVVDAVMENPSPNPRKLDRRNLKALLNRAVRGEGTAA